LFLVGFLLLAQLNQLVITVKTSNVNFVLKHFFGFEFGQSGLEGALLDLIRVGAGIILRCVRSFGVFRLFT
jgi:hypothetical protein